MLKVLCAICVFAAQSLAQNAMLSGVVKDSTTLEFLVGANVSLVGTTQGAATTSEGLFTIRDIPPALYILRVSFVSYAVSEQPITLRAGDSLFVEIMLQPEEVESDEVVVTATRTVRNIADVPVRIEAVPQAEIEEKLLMTPSNVAMLLNESTGMRVQTTSATSNTANLRIQGLSGRYTQILTDGVPSFGGLSAGFGLTQLLPLNLRQVEIIKGASSVLYGADAISGVVNFITKDPKSVPELNALVNATTQRGFDLAAFYARQLGDVGLSVMASRNTQSLFDVDGDGFGDVAEFERYSVSPKLIVSLSENLRLRATLGVLSEDRVGGAVNGSRFVTGAGVPYREDVKTRRVDATAQLDWTISDHRAMTVKLAGMQLRRDAIYGAAPFNATQRILYTDIQHSWATGAHAILFGATFNAEEFNDNTPVVGSARSYRFNAPALFLQDEATLSQQWTLLLSGRFDFHNELGTFFTPRASLMFKPTNMLTMRIGTGTGFKAPTIFIEEAEEAGFRNVRPMQNLQAEKAVSGSFDINGRAVFNGVAATFNLAFYTTKLSNGLLADEDSLQNNIIVLRNANGATVARGAEFSAKFSVSDLKLSVGYTYLYATQSDRGKTYELTLNPRHSFGAVLVWENEEYKTKVGLEQYWTGPQRLERNPFRDTSPGYWITGMIVEKGFGNIHLFLNLENIFDTRQTRYDPLVIGTQSGSVRTVPVYAPLEGRVVNGGVRLVL